MDLLAAESYAEDIRPLFGDEAQVDTFSVWDGTATGMLPPYDVYAATTDAYGSAAEFARAARLCGSRYPSAGTPWTA